MYETLLTRNNQSPDAFTEVRNDPIRKRKQEENVVMWDFCSVKLKNARVCLGVGEGVLGFDRDIIAQTLSQYSGRERLGSEIASVQELVKLNGKSTPPLLRRSWVRFLPRTLKSFQ